MVRYVLRCDEDHRFEAWFRSQADSEHALKSGQATCPVCERANTAGAILRPVNGTAEPAFQ